MKFNKWVITTSLPLVLASCGGGGGSGVAVQRLLENATNLETQKTIFAMLDDRKFNWSLD